MEECGDESTGVGETEVGIFLTLSKMVSRSLKHLSQVYIGMERVKPCLSDS